MDVLWQPPTQHLCVFREPVNALLQLMHAQEILSALVEHAKQLAEMLLLHVLQMRYAMAESANAQIRIRLMVHHVLAIPEAKFVILQRMLQLANVQIR